MVVVAHHANLAAHDFGNSSIPALDYGWLGVDFFFVLSGFIITWSAPGKTSGQFAWHRFRRVVLPYLPIGVGMALLYTFVPGVSEGSRSWSWLTSLTLFPINAEPALSVAWTLQHEMLFYGLFLLCWFNGRFALGLGLWAALIVLALMLKVDWLALRPINLEFIFGVLACWVVREKQFDRRWSMLAIIPLAAWFLLGLDRDWSPLVGLAIAFVIPALVHAEQNRKLTVPRWMIFAGTASYSLYLAHGLAISIAARIMPLLPVTMIAGVLGGIAYYFAVELPILKASRIRRSAPVT